MAYDKVVDSVKLDSDLASVANGIRSILGSTAKMGLDGMPTQLGTAVSEISTQADLMAQLSTILEGKAAGGGGGGHPDLATGEFTVADSTNVLTIDTGITGKIPVYVLVVENGVANEHTDPDRYSPVVAYFRRNALDNEFNFFSNEFGGACVGTIYRSSTTNTTSLSGSITDVRAFNNNITSNGTNYYNVISFRDSSNLGKVSFTTAEKGSGNYGFRVGKTYTWYAFYRGDW